MDTIFVERARSDEQAQLIEWGLKGTDNYFDPTVLGYPTTANLKAVSKTKTVLYMPIQTAYILESLALNPTASKHEITVALRQIVSQLRFNAFNAGIGELYFLGTNDATNEFAAKHDFEELPWKIFRMRTYFDANQQDNAQGLQGRKQDIQTATASSVR